MSLDQLQTNTVRAAGLTLSYREAGEGSTAVLLHGWPTSSHMWRNILPPLAAAGRRAIAPDLPGYGASDKPPDAPYTLDYYCNVLDEWLSALGIERTALVVHDLGGPVGLLWAVRNPGRVERLVVLDTLVYLQAMPLMRAMLALSTVPGMGRVIASRPGLSFTMRAGVVNRRAMAGEVLEGYLAPFAADQDRRTLIRALTSFRPAELEEVAAGLHLLWEVPALIVWGDNDPILPKSEMHRLHRSLPQARAVVLPHCSHFLPEDQPEELGRLLAEFLSVDGKVQPGVA